MTDLIQRLSDEADLCRNEGADDIAILIDDAVYEIVRQTNNAMQLNLQVEALRADAERLRLLLSDARCALDYHQEQTRPIHSTRTALEAIDAELRKV